MSSPCRQPHFRHRSRGTRLKKTSPGLHLRAGSHLFIQPSRAASAAGAQVVPLLESVEGQLSDLFLRHRLDVAVVAPDEVYASVAAHHTLS